MLGYKTEIEWVRSKPVPQQILFSGYYGLRRAFVLGEPANQGKDQGNVEAYEFTDIDRSVSVGASLQGSAWRRSADTIGLAAVVNGISASRERYLNAGGLGLLIGDGKLPHPRAEQIVETYYKLAVFARDAVSLDYQWVMNPAYNTDRGPVSIVAIRVHAQF